MKGQLAIGYLPLALPIIFFSNPHKSQMLKVMFQNYLKIALRSLRKQKGLATINILGLSIGLACFSLFLLYAVNEFSFDRFHSQADQLYRVYRWVQPMHGRDAEKDTYMPMPLGPALQADFPAVEEVVRMREDWGPEFVRIGGEVKRQGIAFADPAFFRVFDFPVKFGNAENPLQDLTSVVLTEGTALRLFGEANPVGRTLEIKLDEEFVPLTVAAVVKNLPPNSTIDFEMMGNFDFFTKSTKSGKNYIGSWTRSAFQTYVLLREASDLPHDEASLTAFRKKYYPGEEERMREAGNWTGEGAPVTYGLQPLRAMHTDTNIGWGAVEPKNIWTLLAIAAGLLLIAVINFTTLSIGRSAGRAREVGVRKVIGGQRGQLVNQFLTEAMLLAGLSAVIGVAVAQLLLPHFNELAGRELVFSIKKYPEMTWLLLGLTLLVGLLAGSYPALVLSSFRPVEVLKSKVKLGGSNYFTRSLVTVQFVLSIGLIASTLIILEQVDFMRTQHPGFEKENVVVVNAEGTETVAMYPRFRQLVQGRPEIAGIAGSELGLGAGTGWSRTAWSFNGERKEVFEYLVDSDYLDVMGMQLLAGRNFLPPGENEHEHAVIANEAMVRAFGWTPEMAVGQPLTGYFDEPERPLPVVVGVVKDFNFRPLGEEVEPMMLHQYPDFEPFRYFVRLRPGDPQPAIAALEAAWNEAVPGGFPFTFSFLDEDIDQFYRSEQRFSSIIGWAGGISIFLACLGLFGLAALAAVNRTKEIGIRKILGASVLSLTSLLSKEFLILVILSLVIATPLAWYFLADWLNGFAARIDFPWWYFGVAGVLALVVAFLSVGFQGLRAALVNPVESLKNE